MQNTNSLLHTSSSRAPAARPSRLHSRLAVMTAVAVSVSLIGCAEMSPRERGTAGGAAIGAAGGAIIAAGTGGRAGTGAVVGGVLGAVAGNLWSKRMEDKRHNMEQATRGTGIVVARTPNNELMVNVPSDFSFDVGRSNVRRDMQPVLDQFAQGLDPSMVVRIVGHTDSTGNDGINNPLSIDRAQSVRDYLVMRGVNSTRIATSGMGSHQPVASNDSDAGRAQNRRVEIFLRDPQG